eukprot:g15775.t1
MADYIDGKFEQIGSARCYFKPNTYEISMAMQQLLEAVGFLHENQVAHRDIKPENVLMAAGSQWKLADFNLACEFDRSATKPMSEYAGTRPFMAPEVEKRSYTELWMYDLCAVVGLLAPEKERFDAEGRVCRPVRGTACGVARNPVGDEMAPALGGSVEDKVEAVYQAILKVDIPQVRPSNVRCSDYSDKALRACALWRECEVYVDLVEETCTFLFLSFSDLVHYFHKTEPKGDGAILIFLPGWGDITKTYIRLYQSGENYKLITLHSLMTPEQQHEAFERPPKGTRKVVLSTNIAEASVTIDDVVYVIDTGVRKERSYDAGTGISSLDAKMVTKANAIQRRGRAGRCQEGLVVHLFPSFKFKDFEQFPIPQMLSSSMEEVVLQSKVIHGGSNSEISSMLTNSMAAPQPKAVDAAVKLLKDMSCLTRSGDLTVLGRAVAAIPVQPNVAKFLLIAAAFRCIKPAACVAAFLSIKSPFQQSVSEQDKNKVTGKDYFNKGFASDHLTMIQAYVEWRREALRGRGDDFCDEQGLSPETLDMAFMMVQQFVSFMVDAGYDGSDPWGEHHPSLHAGTKASDTDALLKAAMVAGFQPNICVLYRGQRSPYWYLDSNEEVSPFRGSANADYQMSGQEPGFRKREERNGILFNLRAATFAMLMCGVIVGLCRESGALLEDKGRVHRLTTSLLPWLVLLLVFFCWQRIRSLARRPLLVFLDKLCIAQHDPSLKEQGILGLAAFLDRSDHLTVLWSPRYLTRLWCGYELATFLRDNSESKPLTFFPVNMSLIVLLPTIYLSLVKVQAQDGEEWMVFSDSMKMGRFNSIMDSSLVFSPFVLLFANAVMIDEKKGEIRFDKWYAYIQAGPWIKELLFLRSKVMPQFKEAIESRDLSSFPMELVQRMTDFLKQRPIRLDKIEAANRSIDEEVTGAARKHLSTFEWPEDLGEDEEEEDEQPRRPDRKESDREEPVPPNRLPEVRKTSLKKSKGKASAQARDQRGAAKKRPEENFLRKFELAKVVQAQDQATSGLDLSSLTDGLDEVLQTADRTETRTPNTKRPGRKASHGRATERYGRFRPLGAGGDAGLQAQAASDEREMAQFQNVLKFQAFRSDPFGALEQHLKNSIRLQKEEEASVIFCWSAGKRDW